MNFSLPGAEVSDELLPPPMIRLTHTVLPFLTLKWMTNDMMIAAKKHAAIATLAYPRWRRKMTNIWRRYTTWSHKMRDNKKYTNEVLQSSGVFVEWLNHYKVSFLSSFPGYNKLLHHKLLNNWATWTGKNKTRLVNFSYKWHKKCVQDLNKTGLS